MAPYQGMNYPPPPPMYPQYAQQSYQDYQRPCSSNNSSLMSMVLYDGYAAYGGYPVAGAAYPMAPYSYPYPQQPPLAPGAVFLLLQLQNHVLLHQKAVLVAREETKHRDYLSNGALLVSLSAAAPPPPGARLPAPPAAESCAPPPKGGVSGQRRDKGKRGALSEGAMGRNVKKRGAGADMSVYGQGGGQGTSDPNELYTDLATIDTATTTSSAATTTSTATGTATAHYCEACQKGFALTTAWEAHVATHEGCPHPGCQFSATKKIVGAHWKLVHGQFSGNGLKEIEVEVDGGDKMTFKVLCGTSPEEVREWREERKRLFPSAATVKAKEEERQKLIEAGGVDEQAPKSSWASGPWTSRRQDCRVRR